MYERDTKDDHRHKNTHTWSASSECRLLNSRLDEAHAMFNSVIQSARHGRDLVSCTFMDWLWTRKVASICH